MAPNNDAQYRMDPSRMQNLLDEATAQQNMITDTYDPSEYFETWDEDTNRRTKAKKKIPTKPAVFFTYTKGELKKKKTRSGKVQHRVIVKKAKRKDKREAVEKLIKEHEATAKPKGATKCISIDGRRDTEKPSKESQAVAEPEVAEKDSWSQERQKLAPGKEHLRQRLNTVEEEINEKQGMLRLALEDSDGDSDNDYREEDYF